MATLLRDPIPDTDAALLGLLTRLRERGYRFVTPTPASHARVLARPNRRVARCIEDVLGWSLPFAAGLLEPQIEADLHAADAIVADGGMLRSRYRVSSLHDCLFLHSAYPTEARNSVFFGPDSYRFADFIARELKRRPLAPGARLLDIGAGAGVGAIAAARLAEGAQAVMTDINPGALRLARINARAAGIAAECVESDTPPTGPFDLALANPPYMIDSGARDYRDGGDMHGGAVTVEMARQALPRLEPGGRFLLYSGSAIVSGEDALERALGEVAAEHGAELGYREIDPDVFGEELSNEAYRDVDRIALVTAVFTAAGG